MNKITGIIVGVILLLVVVGVVAKVFLFPSTDAATRATTKPGAMKLIELDAPILAIIPAEPTGSENAGVHYAKAIEVYLANEKVIFEAAAAISAGDLKADKDAPQSLKALEEMRGHIASGTQQAGMKFLAENSSGTLQVSKSDGNIKNLGMAIDMLDMLGDYYIKNKRTDDANAVFREMFIAGLHMIQARSHMHMVTYGMDIQESALNGISRAIPRDLDPLEARKLRAPLREYMDALEEFTDKYEKKAEIFTKALFDAGDIWNIAENDEDRSWRVQAILAMGLIKYTHLSKANQSYNNSLIEKFLKSNDPVEKAAATAAKAYSEIEFNTAGTTW
ncbi:MAG: hypothetical protein QGH94_09175 [Phycisphaerae bacterium]|jgi:tetratricopeptide (TPR) repeat protein|nr:hypothetical protein [Phycisphaerae bacterium]